MLLITLSRVEVTEEHIRHIMLYEYQQGKTATTAVKKVEEVYGDGVLNVREVSKMVLQISTR